VGIIGSNQSFDDLSKGGEGKVDVDALVGPTSSGLCFFLPFGTCQIDQIKFADLDLRFPIDFLLLLDPDHKDTVRPGRIFVHIGRPGVSAMTAFLEFLVHLVNSGDGIHAKTFNIDAFVFILVDLQFLVIVFEQVIDLFVVEFEHGNFN